VEGVGVAEGLGYDFGAGCEDGGEGGDCRG
jgi:hypothetical protein